MSNRRPLRIRFSSLGVLVALGVSLVAAPARAAVQLSASAAEAFDVTVQAEGLSQPVDVAVLPNGHVVVITRTGDVLVYAEPNGEPTEAHIDVLSGQDEQGLLGVVLDPSFATNRFVYFYASVNQEQANRHQVLRYTLGEDGQLGERQVVVSMGLRGPANHNGGALDIHDGNLYLGVGDTGANNTPPSNKFGTCLNIANGKVLRVSLAEATLGQPAEGNPLLDQTMVTGCDSPGGALGMREPEKRIYAWGFRNPFRLWVDPTSGKLWVGDVGEETREEVSVGDSGHYGYPFVEGTTEYNQAFKPENGCMGITPATPCTPAAYDWPRGGGGTAIGGRILDGCGWPEEWRSRYIFADYVQNDVWTIEVNANRDGVVPGSVEDFASANGPVAFRMGTDNALYIVEARGGTVTRVTAKGVPATPGSCAGVNDLPDDGPVGGGGSGGNGTAGSPAGGDAPGAGNGPGGGAPSAGSTGNPSGGSNASAGSGNASGAASGAPDGDSGGCGCRVAGQGGSFALGLASLAGVLGVTLLRRRRQRRG